MKLAAVISGLDHPCYQFRLQAYESFLGEADIELDPRPIPKGIVARRRYFSRLANADVVIWQRKLFQSWELAALRKHARRLIYDFDDAIMYRDSYSTKGLRSRSREKKFHGAVRTADLVIAGNQYLADLAAKHVRRAPIKVIPTCINTDEFQPYDADEERREVVLGWIGSRSTLNGLALLLPVLEEAAERHPNMQLKIIADQFLQSDKLTIIPVRWTRETAAGELAQCQIGISYVPDDEWSRGKCGLKILQYGAVGLPTLANPVGVHNEMVKEGETGYLPASPEQWQARIDEVVKDFAFREILGTRAMRFVEEHYSTKVWAEHLIAAIRDGAPVAGEGDSEAIG